MAQQRFKQVGLFGVAGRPGMADFLPQLCAVLDAAGIEVLVLDKLAGALDGDLGLPLDEMMRHIDWAIIVGGDGSLLSVAWPLAKAGVPFTGINLGRVGFLADIVPQDVAGEVDRILSGDYLEQQRILLSARLGEQAEPVARALNEFLLHSPEAVSLSDFVLQADERHLYSIRADGMIVSTPTGSTAYSLSAGGPILAPGLSGMSVVPMLAHSTGYGSVVLPMNTALQMQARQPTRLTADGEEVASVLPEQVIRISAEPKRLRQLHPRGYDFFGTVRAKLGWGSSRLSADTSQQDE